MPFSIDTALVTQFTDQVHMLAQQKQNRLAPVVKTSVVAGKDKAIERLDRVEAIEIFQRHADTQMQDITHSRRKLAMREFRITLPIDDFDQVSTLIDPQAGYIEAMVAGMNRVKDRLVGEAAFAEVLTGRNFGTAVNFANDGGLTVSAGGTGLTYEKLTEARENFIDNDIGVDMGHETFLLVTGQQNSNMLAETELTSGDFTREYAVESGMIMNAVGFKVIHFSGTANQPIVQKVSTTRNVVAIAKDGIELGISKDITFRINERPDKNNLIQVQACFFAGATRVEGAMVQKIEAVES